MADVVIPPEEAFKEFFRRKLDELTRMYEEIQLSLDCADLLSYKINLLLPFVLQGSALGS